MANFKWRNPTPPWIQTLTFSDYDPNTQMINQLNSTYGPVIRNNLKNFENYSTSGEMTWDEFNKNPIPFTKVHLKNDDFVNGTVRLRVPAHYVLDENIVFEPNKNDDFFPTAQQTSGGENAEYPVAPFGGFHLGFFAAITIESSDILLDLNGKVLRQSKMFNLQQRFYANIEVANTPFIPKQGPANFGDVFHPANKSYICNGYLGLSSHHGIHGNGAKNLVIQNLSIFNFEVAGIALNGSEDCLIRNIQISNMSKNIPVLSTYSAGRFIRRFLENIIANQSDPSISFASGTKSGTDILNELKAEMAVVELAVSSNTEIPDSSIFKNKQGLYDGGGYGIVLNSLGVVVNGFKKNRDGAIGNTNIVVHDVTVENTSVGSGEILGISTGSIVQGAYGGNAMVGPIGGIFQVENVIDQNGHYVGNSLSNAKIYVAKFGKKEDGTLGTSNITSEIVDWAVNQNTDINQVIMDCGKHLVSGLDSMGHIMKGFINIFLSAAKYIKVFNIKIANSSNLSIEGVENRCNVPNLCDIKPKEYIYQGSSVKGITITGSEDIEIKNVDVSDLKSLKGVACAVDLLETNKNIICREKIKCSGICSSEKSYELPNPEPIPFFVSISDDSTENILVA